MKKNSTYCNHSNMANSPKLFSSQVNEIALYTFSFLPDSDYMLAYPACKMEDSQLSGHVIPASYDPVNEPARLKTLCLRKPTSAMVVTTKDDKCSNIFPESLGNRTGVRACQPGSIRLFPFGGESSQLSVWWSTLLPKS